MSKATGRLALVVLAALAFVFVTEASAQVKGTLRVAADPTFPPFAYRTPQGKLEGFTIDLIDAVSKEMGVRYEFVNQDWSGIFAGLYAGHYDVIIAPTTITAQRAESMAFTEGYIETELGFATLKGKAFSTLEALRGQTLAVNNGSVSDTWATNNAEKHGFTVQRYLKVPDAVQAVQTRRAFAALAEFPSVAYIVKQLPVLAVPHRITLGGFFGYAVKPDRLALRNELDRALECVKRKRVLAGIYKKWFGAEPEASSVVVKPLGGYGHPGFKYYESTSQGLECK